MIPVSWLGVRGARKARRALALLYHLNFKGGKFSKSRGAAVDMPYSLGKHDSDALRFHLTATAREMRDAQFSSEDFVERDNWVLSVDEGTRYWLPLG